MVFYEFIGIFTDFRKFYYRFATVPYLLRNVAIENVNQVWSADITYIRMAHGFVYLVAIIDWYS